MRRSRSGFCSLTALTLRLSLLSQYPLHSRCTPFRQDEIWFVDVGNGVVNLDGFVFILDVKVNQQVSYLFLQPGAKSHLSSCRIVRQNLRSHPRLLHPRWSLMMLGSLCLKPLVLPNSSATSVSSMSPTSVPASDETETICTPTSLRLVP